MRRKHSLTQIKRLCRSFTKNDASGIALKSDATWLAPNKKWFFPDVCIRYTRTKNNTERYRNASKVPKSVAND